MTRQNDNLTMLSNTGGTESAKEELDSSWSRLIRRRKFLQGLGAAGAAAAALPATTLFAKSDKKLSKDDVNPTFAVAASFRTKQGDPCR